MKKTAIKKPRKADSNGGDELQPEYRFDYSKARPNRFAGRVPTGGRVVSLDPDVAEVFTSAESVNSVLRALITTMPKSDPG